MTQADSQSAGFHWTGNPFVDFGIKTLMLRCGLTKRDDKPEQLTVAQVKAFATNSVDDYFKKPDLFKSVMALFGINFLNPSQKKTPEKQKANVRRYLYAAFDAKPDPKLPPCTFFKTESALILNRDTFPLIMGQGLINFYPEGQPGLAVSGQAATAIQAILFGALRCQGKLVVLESDDPNLRHDVLQNWVNIINKRIGFSKINGDDKGTGLGPPKTILLELLADLASSSSAIAIPANNFLSFDDINEAADFKYRGSATLYHFSNSGQEPSMDIYRLSAPVLELVQTAQLPKYQLAWAELRSRNWVKPNPKGKSKKKEEFSPDVIDQNAQERTRHYNFFYEALFKLPENERGFVRRFFFKAIQDLVLSAPTLDEQKLPLLNARIKSLSLFTDYFLKEVLSVEQKRIDEIRRLADRLADVVEIDDRWYKRISYVRSEWDKVRKLLVEIQQFEVNNKRSPVITFDQFLLVFEIAPDAAYLDWRLAWDLIRIRLMEVLYQREFVPEDSATLTLEETFVEDDELVEDAI